jgi:peroxiredoxin
MFMVTCAPKKEEKRIDEATTTVAKASDLPAMTITKMDGSKHALKDVKGKTVLILFQPDCDHCQREATQIAQNLDKFKDYQLYFISSDALPNIEKFSSDYNLKDKSNVQFAWTPTENVLNTLGPIQAPSLYIYNEDGKLVQSFNGEVAIEVVLKYI